MNALLNVNLRFRPSLVIFVDQPGEEICKQLKWIIRLTEFEDVLHQCIALLQVTSRTTSDPAAGGPVVDFDQAMPIPVGAEFPRNDQAMPTQPDDLENLIAAALTSIQLNRRIINIRTAGYPVPETKPQIYIVGNARSLALREVHRMVRAELRRRYFASEVCYVLDAYETTRSGVVGVDDSLAPARPNDPHWLGEDVPNFCFFYEDYLTYPVPSTVTQMESYYAAAESLFALIATGITPEPRFADFMRLPARLTSYTNVGSMNTTLLIFPREAALTFASARLGYDLVQQWLDDLNREFLPERVHRGLQDRARYDVAVIEEWIKDTDLRPGANEGVQEIPSRRRSNKRQMIENEHELNRWPTLDVLRDDGSATNRDQIRRTRHQHQGLLRDVEDQTNILFELFHLDDVEREVRRFRKRPGTWVRLLDQRGLRALEAHSEWSQIATSAWDAAGSRALTNVRHNVDTLWSDRRNGVLGFEMARTYVDTFDEGLGKLQERLINLRVAHQRNYAESLDDFEHLSNGIWLRQPGLQNQPPNALPGAMASPTMGRPAGVVPPGGAGTGIVAAGGGAGTGAGAATHRDLSAAEMRIVDQLERRVLWWQEQVPSIPTQLAVSAPFLLALVLASQAFVPQESPLVIVGITLAAALILGLANGLFWRRYWKKVREAKKDLLRFYTRIFAHRSESREDELRLAVMTPLRRSVMRMRERLDNIATFIGGVQTRLHESAEQVQQEMFTTPSGARDIYIMNGERLQERDKNTMEELAAQVTLQRTNQPVEPWHQSLPEMKERLIEEFRQQSIIEMSEDAAWQQIDTFTRDVTRNYLHGQLDNIQRALESPDVWNEARERAGSPLYQAMVGYRKPEMFFVCGRPAVLTPLSGALTGALNGGGVARKAKWPTDATPVFISEHHNWVLFAAFFKGGTPPALNPGLLFPARRALDGSGGGGGAGRGGGPLVPAPAVTLGAANGSTGTPAAATGLPLSDNSGDSHNLPSPTFAPLPRWDDDDDVAAAPTHAWSSSVDNNTQAGGVSLPNPLRRLDEDDDEDDDYTPIKGIPRPPADPDNDDDGGHNYTSPYVILRTNDDHDEDNYTPPPIVLRTEVEPEPEPESKDEDELLSAHLPHAIPPDPQLNDDDGFTGGSLRAGSLPTPASQESEEIAVPPNLDARQRELFKFIQKRLRDPNSYKTPDPGQQ